MTIQTEIITYQADDLMMISHFYFDDAVTGPRPAVLVFPEFPGLGDHAKSSARRLATLGYAALACDLHGNGQILSDHDVMKALLATLRESPKRVRARAAGGLTALTARPEVNATKVAAIGYCFGGTMAMELARGGAPIQGVVVFHGGLGTPEPGAGKIRGKVLVCIGADDPSILPEQRVAFEKEMRDANVDWRMHIYGRVVHSFTISDAGKLGMPAFARYDASAEARSWSEMRALFDEIFA